MEIAVGGRHLDWGGRLVRLERRVDVVRQAPEEREVGQRGDQATGQDDLLAADAVGERAEYEEEGRADQQGQPDQPVSRDEVELQVDQDEE